MMDGSILVAVLGGAAMATFLLGLWLPAYIRHRGVQRRLSGFVHAGSASGFAIDLGGRRRSRAIRRHLRQPGHPLIRYLNRKIIQSQADLSVGEIIAAMAVLVLLAFTIVSIWSRSVIIGAAAVPPAASLPILWLDHRRARLRTRFARQLLDVLALLSSAVRSGHSLLQALEHVATEAAEPARSAVALVVREIGLGASQDEALERLADRFPSEDLELVVSAINVHQQIGGSLSKVLDAIAETIRERLRIAGDISALTAQQRYSAYVLALLPVVAAGVLYLVSPEYIAALFNLPELRVLAAAAGACVVVGFFAMRWLASVDV